MKKSIFQLVTVFSILIIWGCNSNNDSLSIKTSIEPMKVTSLSNYVITINPGADIQTYIDQANAAGGGIVNLASGTWSSTKKPLYMKSNVTLNLNSGCNLSAYSITTNSSPVVRNIAITGSGNLIQATRNTVIALNTAKVVTVSGITVTNSSGSNWTTRYDYCDSVLIQNLNILANVTKATDDGIDLCNCRWVTVCNNYIQSGDDGISLKAWPSKPNGTNNINVYGNTFNCPNPGCGSSIGIGNETNMEICDVNFHDNIIQTSSNFKYKLWVKSPGPVHRIYYSNNSGATLADLQVNTQNPGSTILYDVYYDGVKIY